MCANSRYLSGRYEGRMKNSRVLLEEIALGKTMGEGMAKICDSHSIQSKCDPEGGKKGGGSMGAP